MGTLSSATSDLTGLYSIFDVGPGQVPRARFVSPDETPEPFRRLLAHDHHMTVTVENYYASKVRVLVIKSLLEGNWYARKIALLPESDPRVVMFGIMRFNFSWCTDEVREQIIEGQTPLGRILIEADVLRRISTHALMRIEPNQQLRDLFGMGRPKGEGASREVVYGRLATIFCDEEPAVDLLEVTSPYS